MAPRNQLAAGKTTGTPSTLDASPVTSPTEELAAAHQEIEHLRAILADRDIRERAASPDKLASVLEALSLSLSQGNSPVPKKSTKIPDPPPLTDGKDPTFESWKLQIRGKLRVNADHFPSDEARMAYVYGRTGGDAQKHLNPRYNEKSDDPFTSDNEMIDHLADIYEDRYRVQNARLEYRSLMMRSSESFADFHTRFLHLAGEAHIPTPDLRPDLFDKLTIELQRTVLPIYSTLNTARALADECLVLDQGLRRLKARSERVRNRNLPPTPPTKPLVPSNPRGPPGTPSGPSSRGNAPERTRPVYSDPATQALSNQGACFACGKKGHFARDCSQKQRGGIPAVQEMDIAEETDNGSGKVEL
jgi:hypothetical protein